MTLEWIWHHCALLLWWLSDWSLNVDIHSIFSCYVRNYRNTRHYLSNWVLWCILHCNSIGPRTYQNVWYISINYWFSHWIAVADIYIKSCINCQYFHCQTCQICHFTSSALPEVCIPRTFILSFVGNEENMLQQLHTLYCINMQIKSLHLCLLLSKKAPFSS